jgi:hypothetical protein
MMTRMLTELRVIRQRRNPDRTKSRRFMDHENQRIGGDAPGRSRADRMSDLRPKSIGLTPFARPVEPKCNCSPGSRVALLSW